MPGLLIEEIEDSIKKIELIVSKNMGFTTLYVLKEIFEVLTFLT